MNVAAKSNNSKSKQDCGQKSKELADQDKNDKVPTRPNTPLPPNYLHPTHLKKYSPKYGVNEDSWSEC